MPLGGCERAAEEAPDQGKGQQRQAEQNRKDEVIDHKVELVWSEWSRELTAEAFRIIDRISPPTGRATSFGYVADFAATIAASRMLGFMEEFETDDAVFGIVVAD